MLLAADAEEPVLPDDLIDGLTDIAGEMAIGKKQDIAPAAEETRTGTGDSETGKKNSPIVVSRLDNVVTLSFEEARRLAFVNSSELVALRAARAVVEARGEAVWDIEDPELRLRYGKSSGRDTDYYNSSEGDIPMPSSSVNDEEEEEYQAGIRFFVPNPWILSRRAEAEHAYLEAANAQLRHAEWLVTVRLKELFAEINYYEKDVRLTDSLVKLHADTLEKMKMGSGEGVSTMQDTMIESRRYMAAIAGREKASRLYRTARKELSGMVEIPESQLCILIREDELLPDLPKRLDRMVVSDIWMSRPDFSALRWNTRAAHMLVKAADRTRIPWISFLQFSYGISSQDYDPTKDDVDEWRIDAACSLPLFSWFNDAAKQRMQEYEQALVNETQYIRHSYIDLQNALEDYKNAKKQWERYETETVPVVKSMERLLETVEAGSDFSVYDKARIREQLIDTQRLKLQSDLEMHQAVIGISRLLGPAKTAVGRDQGAETSEQ